MRVASGDQRGVRAMVCSLRQLVLVFAVIIHGPDFLVAAAIADEGDLRAGDSRQAAGKLSDNFIGELMREGADLRVGGLAAIHFSDHRRQGSIADIVQPGLNFHVACIDGEGCRRRAVAPKRARRTTLVIDFRGSCGRLQRVEALAHQVEDAAVIQVFRTTSLKEHGQGLRRGVLGRKIRHADAGFGNAEAGAGLEPVLRGRGRGTKKEKATTDEHGYTQIRI
jgi:hypothetical protein